MEIVRAVGWLLVLSVNVVRSDVICMQCDQAADVDECLSAGTVKCGPQEQCFLEKVTTKNLNFVYNAGCRSTLVCNIMSSLGGGTGRRDLSRPSRELVNCAQCCNTAPGVASKGPCNSELCGTKPAVNSNVRCLACDNLVSGSAACSEKAVCTDTEVCATSIHILGGSLIKYNFRCEEKHFCEAMIKNGLETRASQPGGVKICDACCKDSECNKKDCFQLRKLMPAQFGNGTATTTAPKPSTAAQTTKPTTPIPTTTVPTTPIPTTTVPTTPVPTTTVPTTPVPTTTVPTTPVPTTTVPTTPVPTTTVPTTPVPTTTVPTTPVPTTTVPTTPVPTTTVPTTPVPTTTVPTTPVPSTPAPSTKPSQPPSNKPSSSAPSSGTTPVPSTPAPSTKPSQPPSNKPSSSAPSSGSSRKPSTFAPNFTVI